MQPYWHGGCGLPRLRRQNFMTLLPELAPITNMSYTASGAWICHTGKVRKQNEDACLFGGVFSGASTSAAVEAKCEAGMWVVSVADGIGGHKAGAYASREVVDSLSKCAELNPEGIERNLQETNNRLHQAGVENPDLTGTGAAVVGIFAGEGGLFAFNVGDARLYRQEGGKFRQVTSDDSVEAMLVAEGLMRASDGIRPATMHALTQSIGGSREIVKIEPHFHLLPVSGTARFLLCSDGLSDMLSQKEIERIAIPLLSASAAVEALFHAAMEAGGKDNVTIAIVDVQQTSTNGA
jgi:PPM family protein phosphatase